ncbi:hypothetical protein ACFU67_25445 [Streptomyces rhizosphaericola]|uniref:hypothetical protein n=1 Tax=Streptomyces rhizosphaericola TaxID=2564098 RepID=UPI003686A82D
MSNFPAKARDVFTDAWEAVWEFIVDASLWVLLVGGPIAFLLVDFANNKKLDWTMALLENVSAKGKSWKK